LKLLIDNQLPEALATFFVANGIESHHVRRLGLGAAPDAEIWRVAKTEGYAIVTMDEDFQHLAARYGTPPQVIWVRLGNVRQLALLNAFSALLPELRAGLENGIPVIEIG
jgi:predicted nuclease of predicted toxin-antitoxin system